MKIVNPTAKRGEDIAVQYLQKRGYKILERNFRKGYGEIDIIAVDVANKEYVLVFVEVKTRTSNQFGTPFEAIAPWKMHALRKTAEFYKHLHPELPDAMRIDAVGIVLDKHENIMSIELLQNIE